MIATIKMSTKGQIVIPEEIREEFNLKEGTKMILIEENKRLILEKEEEFLKRIKDLDKEKLGWLVLAEKSMAKIWDNKKDEQTWKKYL